MILDFNRADMTLTQFLDAFHGNDVGAEMYGLIEELYPICRSITGNGLRQTLRTIQKHIPINIHEVPTGTCAFDWTVPREWNIHDAWVKFENGEKIIDFAKSNLHVVNYSVPIRQKMSLSELRPHLHSVPDQPDVIPYRTSYYQENWGFCLPHRQLESLKDGQYEVCIDTQLSNGSLTYGEYYHPGESDEEVLFSCHACHPSLCNDNLSGIALTTVLAEVLQKFRLRYSYRFLFIPGTIGSIVWLSQNEDKLARIRHGLVVACVGDPGKLHYKRSRRSNADIDRAVMLVLRHRADGFGATDFSPYGYDERQYCSPGIDLPVGSLTRTPHGRFPEYHTSADNLEFVQPAALADSLAAYLSVVQVLEEDDYYFNLNRKCEPQLGKRGLYRSMGGLPDAGQLELAMLWVLNQSDGKNSLLDISERSEMPFPIVSRAAQLLEQHGILIRSSHSRTKVLQGTFHEFSPVQRQTQ